MAKAPIKIQARGVPQNPHEPDGLENEKAPVKKKKMSAAVPGAVGGAAVGFAAGGPAGAIAGAAVGTVGGFFFDRWRVYTAKK